MALKSGIVIRVENLTSYGRIRGKNLNKLFRCYVTMRGFSDGNLGELDPKLCSRSCKQLAWQEGNAKPLCCI